MAQKEQSGGAELSERRSLMDRVAFGVFILSLMGVAFAYGVATMKWKIFPHPILADAQIAWDALQQVESFDTPPHFIRYEEGATTPGPSRFVGLAPDAAPDDLIVMTGGFFYRPDLCPDAGCLAWIMDRSGKVYHTWSGDPAEVFAPEDFAEFDGFTDVENIYVQGSDLDADGNLIVTFQGRNTFPYHVGLAKFSPSGALLWKRIDNSHHWPTVGPEGRIYVPSARIEPPKDKIVGMEQTLTCRQGAVYEEGLRIVEPDGSLLAEYWFDALVRQSDKRALAYAVRDDCDPYHINGIDLLNAASAAKLQSIGIDTAQPGDMVASLRSSSTFVVMDRDDGTIKHVSFGEMVAPHSPATLPDGGVLVFDNLGGHDPEGGSRILKLSMGSAPAETVFPRPGQDGQDFSSIAEGAVNASADGSRMLVAETFGGRVLEVEIETGRVLWIYDEIGSTDSYADRIGADSDPRLARYQTQGASYITRDAFERMFGTLK